MEKIGFLFSDHGLHIVSGYIGATIGYIGVAIILTGCLRGMYSFIRKYVCEDLLMADIRIELGHYLALGLEFLVGKDIIESLVEPTWDELGKLAAIIALRTILTFFLGHEIKEVREEMEEESAIRKLRKSMIRESKNGRVKRNGNRQKPKAA
jgi:uncharacterized membrane protein